MERSFFNLVSLHLNIKKLPWEEEIKKLPKENALRAHLGKADPLKKLQ